MVRIAHGCRQRPDPNANSARATDHTVTIGGSRIQHGPLSDRVYLIHLDPANTVTVIQAMQDLANQNGYTKLFAKVPASQAAPFQDHGFETEARIPGFYLDGDAALFLSRFLCLSRGRAADAQRTKQILEAADRRLNDGRRRPLPVAYRLIHMAPQNAEQMAGLYRRVFKSYPFPIFDPHYLRLSMRKNVRYVGIFTQGHPIALAGAEVIGKGVEMTDFATDPAHRNAGLGGHLLNAMESTARKSGIKTAFTISRADSYGINILFARAGYRFAGTLINNTHIAGRLRSMNIWYAPLLSQSDGP